MIQKMYAAVARTIGDQAWFRPVSRKLVPLADKVLVPMGLRSTPWRTLLLTTVGRKSGVERQAPLFFVRAGTGVAVVGTNYGGQEPNWSKNLAVNPICTITLDKHTTRRHARLASDEEQQPIFSRFAEFYPAYDDYKERAGRDIPIWILESVR